MPTQNFAFVVARTFFLTLFFWPPSICMAPHGLYSSDETKSLRSPQEKAHFRSARRRPDAKTRNILLAVGTTLAALSVACIATWRMRKYQQVASNNKATFCSDVGNALLKSDDGDFSSMPTRLWRVVEQVKNRNAVAVLREKGSFSRELGEDFASCFCKHDFWSTHDQEVSRWAESRGLTLEKEACISGILGILFDQKDNACINKSDTVDTPLTAAASTNNTYLLHALLIRGADINQPNTSRLNQTPLMVATMDGCTQALTFLCDKGAGVNVCNRKNETALHHAVLRKNPKAVEILLKQGALQLQNMDGETPEDIVRRMLDSSKTPTVERGNIDTILHLLEDAHTNKSEKPYDTSRR